MDFEPHLLSILGIVLAALALRRITILEREVTVLRHRIGMSPEPAPSDEREAAPAPPEAAEPRSPAAAPLMSGTPPDGTAEPESFERNMASRWMVWIGAVTLALGGVFLAKYAVEQGILGPAARMGLAVLFGQSLILAGEWLRRHPAQIQGGLRSSQVPPALVAAGLLSSFAAIYAAFALHGLIDGPAAFILLAGFCAEAVFLSLRHGPAMALLGFVGALAVPALIPSQTPSPWLLFGWLSLIAAGTLAAARRLDALGLGWPVLFGGGFWVIATDVDGVATAAPGLFLALLFAGLLAVGGTTDRRTPHADRLALAAGLICAFLCISVPIGTGAPPPALLAQLPLALTLLAAARRWPSLSRLVEVTAGAALLMFLAWALAIDATSPAMARWLIAAALTGAGSGAAGYLLLRGGSPPLRWALLSVAPSILLTAMGYVLNERALPAWAWTAAALIAAVASALAAARLLRRREEIGDAPIGAYASGASAALALTLAIHLDEAALTAALSLLVPALAWLDRRLALHAVRPMIAAIAGLVLARLMLNPEILDYPLSGPVHWVIWGYGLPALSLGLSAHWLAARRTDRCVRFLKAGTLALAVVLPTLEIQILANGSLESSPFGLLETSLRTVLWLTVGLALAGADRSPAPDPVRRLAASLLTAAGLLQILALHLLALNPLWSGEEVGPWPLLNLLIVAYALPAGLLLLRLRRDTSPVWQRRFIGAVALLLAFTFVSLEVRQAFHGSDLTRGPTSEAEWYAYSVAWLGFSLALLGLAIPMRRASLRHAALAVLLATVLKVFLSDMADLEGLLRILSFIGLGLSLIGIGWVYQRFVPLRPHRPAAPPTSHPLD